MEVAMSQNRARTVLAAFWTLAAFGPGCGPCPEQVAAQRVVAETKIRQEAETAAAAALGRQYARGVDVILTNDFEGFKAVLDSATQKDGARCGLTWAGLRLLVSLGGMKREDFRIDAVTFNKEMSLAMVCTSHREKGEWKKDAKPQIWTLEGGEWRWMP
jgi:hypothetical protein